MLRVRAGCARVEALGLGPHRMSQGSIALEEADETVYGLLKCLWGWQ